MLFLIQFIREILIGGVDTIVAFTSWDFLSANPWAKLPGLPWTIVAGGAILLGHKLSGKNLAIFAAITMIFISHDFFLINQHDCLTGLVDDSSPPIYAL